MFHFVWVDDFAAARNAALEHATGDYALWLDADDVIEPAERAKLEELLARLPGEWLAATRTAGHGHRHPPRRHPALRSPLRLRPRTERGRRRYRRRSYPALSRLEGVRWTYSVHEQILPALKRGRVPVEWTTSPCGIPAMPTGPAGQEARTRYQDPAR